MAPKSLLLEGLQRSILTVRLNLTEWRRLNGAKTTNDAGNEKDADSQEDAQTHIDDRKLEFYAKGFVQPWDQDGIQDSVKREVPTIKRG